MEQPDGMKEGHQSGDRSSEPRERACWYQVRPKLMLREVTIMGRLFPDMEKGITCTGEMLWQGPVVTTGGNKYQIQIRYPRFFPRSPLTAYMLDPKVREGACVKVDVLHESWDGAYVGAEGVLFSAVHEDGSLRLGGPGELAWNLKWERRMTAATFMLWVCHWLHCYDVWQETGNWPCGAHERSEIDGTNRGVCEKLRGLL